MIKEKIYHLNFLIFDQDFVFEAKICSSCLEAVFLKNLKEILKEKSNGENFETSIFKENLEAVDKMEIFHNHVFRNLK